MNDSPWSKGDSSPSANPIVIQPSRGWMKLDLRELWRFRDLLLTLAIRDVKLRYKQTVLGITWVILQPLLATVVLTFVFDRVAGLSAPGDVPYALFTFAALIAWNVFHGTLTRSSRSLLTDAHLVSKVYFPRIVLPASVVGSVLVDLAVWFLLLAVAMALLGTPLTATFLLLPLLCIPLVLLALGIGLGAGALAVRYRDVQHMVPLLTQTLLYASPVAYWTGAVPERYRPWFELNPLVGLIETFRFAALGVGRKDVALLSYSIAFSLVVFAIGVCAFQALERRFADVI